MSDLIDELVNCIEESKNRYSSLSSFDVYSEEFARFPPHRLHLECSNKTPIEPQFTPHRPFDVIEHIFILYILLNPQMSKSEENDLLSKCLRKKDSWLELRKRLRGVALFQAAELLVIGREKGLQAASLSVKWAYQTGQKPKSTITEFVEIISIRNLVPSISEEHLIELIEDCAYKIRSCSQSSMTMGEVNNFLRAKKPSLITPHTSQKNESMLEGRSPNLLSFTLQSRLDSPLHYNSHCNGKTVIENGLYPNLSRFSLAMGLSKDEERDFTANIPPHMSIDESALQYILADKLIFR